MVLRVNRHAVMFAAILGLALPSYAADPRSVAAPDFAVGDSWVFSDTVEKGTNGFDQKILDMTIERLDGATMVVGLKRDGAPTGYQDQIVGSDWSHRLIVDGSEQTTTRPFSFPLRLHQSWSIDYTDNTRRGPQLSVHVRRTYTVVGWEDVTVPSGTYHALKVEGDGVDEGMIEVPTTAVGGASVSSGDAGTFTQSHRGGRGLLVRHSHSEGYYVPAIKNTVKSIEEQYNADNVRISRGTRVLVSYHSAS